MLSLFFDFKGHVTIDFLEPNATVNGDRYQKTLTKLKADIQNKQRTEPKPQILHKDDGRLHTVKKTQKVIQKLKFDLPHPPYLPDWATADFVLFPKMKAPFWDRIFEFRNNLESEVPESFSTSLSSERSL